MWHVSRSEQTARTLVLIGLVLDAIGFFALVVVGLIFLTLPVPPIFYGLLLVGGVLSLVWLVLVYALSYTRIRDGDLEEARTPTLVFAILSLISGGIVPGILYLVAYLMLGQALDQMEAQQAPARSPSFPPPVPLLSGPTPTTAPAPPMDSKGCPNCGQSTALPARFCRNCGGSLW